MKTRRFFLRGWALLLILPLLLGVAHADVLELPEQLTEIGEEAFANDKAITDVVIPDGATSIGARAFKGCKNLTTIEIPGSVTQIGADFVEGCANELLIDTTPGSAAMQYARRNDVDFRAGTTYRALLVGQMYYGTVNQLRGPINDIQNMAKCLKNYSGTSYEITSEVDLTARGILQAIRSTFSAATENDVSLFYYSGHGFGPEPYYGIYGGELVGVDTEPVSPTELRQVFDQIPGRKVIIIDACYSGNMITSSRNGAANSKAVSKEALDAGAEAFVTAFTNAFATKKRSNLAAQDYYVMTAANAYETSLEVNIGKNWKFVGAFTAYLTEGCGYSYKTEKNCGRGADKNSNGAVSLQEAYSYAYKKALQLAKQLGESQHAMVYPEDCDWFAFLRTK